MGKKIPGLIMGPGMGDQVCCSFCCSSRLDIRQRVVRLTPSSLARSFFRMTCGSITGRDSDGDAGCPAGSGGSSRKMWRSIKRLPIYYRDVECLFYILMIIGRLH